MMAKKKEEVMDLEELKKKVEELEKEQENQPETENSDENLLKEMEKDGLFRYNIVYYLHQISETFNKINQNLVRLGQLYEQK